MPDRLLPPPNENDPLEGIPPHRRLPRRRRAFLTGASFSAAGSPFGLGTSEAAAGFYVASARETTPPGAHAQSRFVSAPAASTQRASW